MSIDATELAEQLATRLCHDLTGPISAINNGAELLEEEGGETGSEALALILGSAKEAARRIQFYRLAYGRVGEASQVVVDEKRDIIDAFFAESKTRLDWAASQTGETVSQHTARLLLNMLIVAGGSLIRGGVITLHHTTDEAGGDVLAVRGEGQTVRLEPEHGRVLNGEAALGQLNPKTAQMALMLHFAQQAGAQLRVSQPEETVLLMQLCQPRGE